MGEIATKICQQGNWDGGADYLHAIYLERHEEKRVTVWVPWYVKYYMVLTTKLIERVKSGNK